MNMEILLMICGCYWIVSSLILNTKNWSSALFFKVLPFFTGVITCLCAMDMLNWVNIFR